MDTNDLEILAILAAIGGAIYMLSRSAPAMAGAGRPQPTPAGQNISNGRSSIYDSVKRAIPLTSQEVDSLNLLNSVLSGNTPIAST